MNLRCIFNFEFMYGCFIFIFLVVSFYRRDISFLRTLPGACAFQHIKNETSKWWKPLFSP